ncbi:hypothetical protein PIB30_006152 [Stylosanthes scabra]|uniref:RNase H type-1 domain-containing protein n=1 Tax=Stylosanthes scabra TaxID=79078 RepID=A0ABU6X2L5_9FABA|nr:hypothetical protein [Stylosanthes scabra]
MVESLKEVIQFLLEEAGVKEEDLTIIIEDKSIVNWLNGENKTGWETRNLRNKASAARHLVKNMKVIHLSRNNLLEFASWEAEAESNGDSITGTWGFSEWWAFLMAMSKGKFTILASTSKPSPCGSRLYNDKKNM